MANQAVHIDSQIGKRIPIHATAVGKAILATLPEERIGDITKQRGLPPLTKHTITSEENFGGVGRYSRPRLQR